MTLNGAHWFEDVQAINDFVYYYNHKRYHESFFKLTPADVYYGRAQKVLQERRKIKEETIAERRKNYIKEKL